LLNKCQHTVYLVIRLSANSCLKQSTLIKRKGGHYVIFNTNYLGPEVEIELKERSN